MNPENLVQVAIENCDAAYPGAYYGSAASMSLGAGLFYDDIPIAKFSDEEGKFVIVDSTVLVLTHECDVANEREFNDHVLICPIISLEIYAQVMIANGLYDRALNLLKDIAANSVYRVFYLPPPATLQNASQSLSKGGLIYLNQITSAPVSFFHSEGKQPTCSLSSYAQNRLDQKIQNHLFRPKGETQPLLT